MNQDNIFLQLNKKQKEAVSVKSGPLLILAGAGSGKTKTLTHRIAYLIASKIPGSQILAVTFTNKAAQELKERLKKILNNSFDQEFYRIPTVGTFHSICVQILRKSVDKSELGFSRNFVIFDKNDSQSLIKQIIKNLGYQEKIKPKAVLSHISQAKNDLLTPGKYRENVEESPFTKVVIHIYSIYQTELRKNNALDFGDLIMQTVRMFERHPEILAEFHNQWKHFCIDEYQDTNYAQYKFIRLLCDKEQNICVIGDDHQSIYAFRGADYKNILNFSKDFPQAKTVLLEQNYRSNGNILKNANAIISKNKTGQEKNLWTNNQDGEDIIIQQVINEKMEAADIAEKIKSHISDGGLYNDCSILYRMNAQSRNLEEAFLRYKIPYTLIGGTRFFDRKEIKDLVAYLRFIANPNDNISFQRIINVPNRKLGTTTLNKLYEYAQSENQNLFWAIENIEKSSLPIPKKNIIENFAKNIRKFQTQKNENNISELLQNIVKKIDYMDFLHDNTEKGESQKNNIKELFSVTQKYDTAENPLDAFLEGVALITDLENIDEQQDSVKMMTIHSSKGLEFPYVFLPGWEEGLFPLGESQMKSPDELEEERRLAYVAITRAEKKVAIFHTQSRTLYGETVYNEPSRFLEEMDETSIQWHKISTSPQNDYSNNFFDSKYNTHSNFFASKPKYREKKPVSIEDKDMPYKIGQKVEHSDWGIGTIVMINGDILTISFAGLGLKKLVASITDLKII